jgi:hypothetical protein
MLKVCKEVLMYVLLLALFSLPSVMAANEVESKATQIKILGKDVNGKYPVYDLDGDLTDVNYFSGNYVFRSGELLDRVGFIEKGDVNRNGYECEFICKDKTGNVVGINPAYRNLGK